MPLQITDDGSTLARSIKHEKALNETETSFNSITNSFSMLMPKLEASKEFNEDKMSMIMSGMTTDIINGGHDKDAGEDLLRILKIIKNANQLKNSQINVGQHKNSNLVHMQSIMTCMMNEKCKLSRVLSLIENHDSHKRLLKHEPKPVQATVTTQTNVESKPVQESEEPEEKSWWTKMMDWFKNLFGGKSDNDDVNKKRVLQNVSTTTTVKTSPQEPEKSEEKSWWTKMMDWFKNLFGSKSDNDDDKKRILNKTTTTTTVKTSPHTTTVKTSPQEPEKSEEKSWWTKMKDWFKNLFGGKSDNDTDADKKRVLQNVSTNATASTTTETHTKKPTIKKPVQASTTTHETHTVKQPVQANTTTTTTTETHTEKPVQASTTTTVSTKPHNDAKEPEPELEESEEKSWWTKIMDWFKNLFGSKSDDDTDADKKRNLNASTTTTTTVKTSPEEPEEKSWWTKMMDWFKNLFGSKSDNDDDKKKRVLQNVSTTTTTVKTSPQEPEKPEEKSWWTKFMDWFKNLFGGKSDNDTTAEKKRILKNMSTTTTVQSKPHLSKHRQLAGLKRFELYELLTKDVHLKKADLPTRLLHQLNKRELLHANFLSSDDKKTLQFVRKLLIESRQQKTNNTNDKQFLKRTLSVMLGNSTENVKFNQHKFDMAGAVGKFKTIYSQLTGTVDSGLETSTGLNTKLESGQHRFSNITDKLNISSLVSGGGFLDKMKGWFSFGSKKEGSRVLMDISSFKEMYTKLNEAHDNSVTLTNNIQGARDMTKKFEDGFEILKKFA